MPPVRAGSRAPQPGVARAGKGRHPCHMGARVIALACALCGHTHAIPWSAFCALCWGDLEGRVPDELDDGEVVGRG